MDIITLLACNTDSSVKKNAILHNLQYYMEISHTIAIINSTEYKDVQFEEEIKKRCFYKLVVYNDILPTVLCNQLRFQNDILKDYSNEQIQQYWIDTGKLKTVFGLQVYYIYFDYFPNDYFVCHGKWMYYLEKNDCTMYKNVILTNDSFIITRPLYDLQQCIDEYTECTVLCDSYEIIYHYPDFFRVYNKEGIKKIITYYSQNRHRITPDIFSVIYVYEIDSSRIFPDAKILYKMVPTNKINIHFVDEYMIDYLYNKEYPVIKIKKISQYTNIPMSDMLYQYLKSRNLGWVF